MYKLKINEKHDFVVEKTSNELLVNGEVTHVDIKKLNSNNYHIINGLQSYNVEVISLNHTDKTAEIRVNNNVYSIVAKDQFDVLLDQLGLSSLNKARVSEIKAPMPGLVLKVFVNEGDDVKKGDSLFILEAMKMENIIKSPVDVNIKAVKIVPGDKVEKGQVLLQFS